MQMKTWFSGLLLATTMAQPAFAVNEYFPTWYVGVNGSASFLDGVSLGGTSPIPEIDRNLGYAAGASAGVRLPKAFVTPLDGLSFEAEVRRSWQEIDNSQLTVLLPVQSANIRDFEMTSYMINAYYHFYPLNTMFVPYIGGGIGKVDMELGANPNVPTSRDQSEEVDAWQGMVGLTFEPHPDSLTEWSVGYRYFSTESADFDDGLGGTTPLEVTTHSLDAGVKFRF